MKSKFQVTFLVLLCVIVLLQIVTLVSLRKPKAQESGADWTSGTVQDGVGDTGEFGGSPSPFSGYTMPEREPLDNNTGMPCSGDECAESQHNRR